MTHKEDYAKEAAQDGRHAARSGKDENPHPVGSFEYAAWNRGGEGVERIKKEKMSLHINPRTGSPYIELTNYIFNDLPKDIQDLYIWYTSVQRYIYIGKKEKKNDP